MNVARWLSKILFPLIFLSCSTDVNEIDKQFRTKVHSVKDGDTIEILYKGKPLTIRLAHIDCPEIRKGQPYSKNAKKLTSDLCYGQTVTVINDGKFDKYKRLIAVIKTEKNINVNKELVKAGLAWHFKKYSSDASYNALEMEARQSKTGLWADKNPIPPWDWKKP